MGGVGGKIKKKKTKTAFIREEEYDKQKKTSVLLVDYLELNRSLRMNIYFHKRILVLQFDLTNIEEESNDDIFEKDIYKNRERLCGTIKDTQKNSINICCILPEQMYENENIQSYQNDNADLSWGSTFYEDETDIYDNI